MRTLFSTALAALVAYTSAECTRDSLKAISADILAAQIAGKPLFPSLGETVKYTENRKAVNISKSILSQPLAVAHNRSQHDTVQCATFSEFIVTDAATPHVIVHTARVDNATGKVGQMDTISTGKGDWLFNVTGTYYWASRENWGPIDASKRDSRAVIQAAADAYCDVFSNKSAKVPWGTPCARLEGGSYTGKGVATDSCNVGVPSGVALVNRQYVIDEEYGTCDVILDFAGKAGQIGAAGLPDSHDFRVEGGKLRYVHTLSSCGGKSCM
ncbi:hypothetical protein EJ04DRAFT_590480 [Polyplosphaeria fusca]|uniref:DUF8021 domain-containing protein n=1 Tax=Polyplosphaeria fusca TaxID=682080 RepID=A0A9P4R262_9PLEO|nr:hypothetical protein EJ04DRAFT_590480 [Polyplosphaeria fusca]